MDDRARLAAMAEELRTKPPMDLVLRAPTVALLVGVLQLALRHPHIMEHDAARQAAQNFIGAARIYFHDCPATLEILAQGDDPSQDR